MSKSLSMFVAGIFVGLLAATGGFTLLVRQQNIQRSAGASAYVLKLGHSLDQAHPVHTAMEFMAQRLAEKSAGMVE